MHHLMLPLVQFDFLSDIACHAAMQKCSRMTCSRSALRLVQVVTLSSQDVPTAYAYELEAATIVQPEQVVEAVQRVVRAAVPA